MEQICNKMFPIAIERNLSIENNLTYVENLVAYDSTTAENVSDHVSIKRFGFVV